MADPIVEPVLVPLTFPELLLMQRMALGLTQRQVARALEERGLEFSAVAVSNWETGKNPPRTAEVVFALEEILECPGQFSEALGLAPRGETPYAHLAARVEGLERQIRDLQSQLQELLREVRGE